MQHMPIDNVSDVSEVAVAVLNWNGRRWLEGCLSALLANTGIKFQAWLVDNGSTDDSLTLVEQRFPWVKVLPLGVNLGFGAAYNRAAHVIPAPLLVLLNNDTIVQPGWLAPLVEDVRAHPEAAVVGAKLLYIDRPGIVNHAGGRLTPLGAAFDEGFGCPDGPRFNQPGTVGCATGAAMIVRRAALLEIGGFDERYFAYFEDADLCWRFWLRGWTARYQPASRVLHAYGGSTGAGRFAAFRIRHCQTNRLQNMIKLLEARTLTWALPASVGYDALRIATALRAGRRGEAAAIVRGTRAFARLVPRLLPDRREIQRARVVSDADLVHIGALATLGQAAREWQRLAGLPGATGV
jgi:GT2 family glycosyltransferase